MAYKATGIILAGGSSSRMGRDKALLELDEQTFLKNSVKKLKKLFEEVIIVTDRTGKYRLPDVKEAVDRFPRCGPLGGIHAGLYEACFDWAFVTACDMPFWNSDTAKFLMKYRSKDFDAVVPEIGGKKEPLFALYNKSCLPMLESALKHKKLKVSEFLSAIMVNYIDMSGETGKLSSLNFVNINTPDDYSSFIGEK